MWKIKYLGVWLNSTHYLIMKINNKRELEIAINHSAGTDYQDFIKFTRECKKKKQKKHIIFWQ